MASAPVSTTITAVRSPRHSALVRITHWVYTLSFFALVVSGVAILLAHTRFYWGETGGEGAPSLFDLPLRLHRPDVSGWGRNLHFLSAWICVLNGFVYVVFGLASNHFRKNLIPTRALLSWTSLGHVVSSHLKFKRPTEEEALSYNVLQRCAYLSIIFLFLPIMALSGLAMSPNITSAVPQLVTLFGGQQSARTIHFFIADFLVLFLVVHITMVFVAGFTKRVRAMITGDGTVRKES
jgi:thiosulfate reductase cytochrome b subunit